MKLIISIKNFKKIHKNCNLVIFLNSCVSKSWINSLRVPFKSSCMFFLYDGGLRGPYKAFTKEEGRDQMVLIKYLLKKKIIIKYPLKIKLF